MMHMMFAMSVVMMLIVIMVLVMTFVFNTETVAQMCAKHVTCTAHAPRT